MQEYSPDSSDWDRNDYAIKTAFKLETGFDLYNGLDLLFYGHFKYWNRRAKYLNKVIDNIVSGVKIPQGSSISTFHEHLIMELWRVNRQIKKYKSL
jgi:hypothetical protein